MKIRVEIVETTFKTYEIDFQDDEFPTTEKEAKAHCEEACRQGLLGVPVKQESSFHARSLRELDSEIELKEYAANLKQRGWNIHRAALLMAHRCPQNISLQDLLQQVWNI